MEASRTKTETRRTTDRAALSRPRTIPPRRRREPRSKIRSGSRIATRKRRILSKVGEAIGGERSETRLGTREKAPATEIYE